MLPDLTIEATQPGLRLETAIALATHSPRQVSQMHTEEPSTFL